MRSLPTLPSSSPLIRLLPQADLILAEQSPSHETSFIILSDLHLDSPKVMSGLQQLLQVYDQMEEKEIPKLFVLCGNFRSRPWLFDGEAMREYTGESARFRLLRPSCPLRSQGRTWKHVNGYSLTLIVRVCRTLRQPLQAPDNLRKPPRLFALPPHPRPNRPVVLRRPPAPSNPRTARQIPHRQNPEPDAREQPVSSTVVQSGDCGFPRRSDGEDDEECGEVSDGGWGGRWTERRLAEGGESASRASGTRRRA